MGCGHDHSKGGHGHGHDDHDEELREVLVTLEEDQIVILEEMAKEYKKTLGQDWDLSAMLRVAVGHFLTKMGKIS
jgi:hypothetical protein